MYVLARVVIPKHSYLGSHAGPAPCTSNVEFEWTCETAGPTPLEAFVAILLHAAL